MRVTNRSQMRNYYTNFNRAAERQASSMQRMTTSQKFLRASEDPINASKALKTRKALRDNDVYRSNLNTAKNVYETAEKAMLGVESDIKVVYERLVGIANGTNTATEDTITHYELDKIAERMVGTMNLAMADRKLFGGTQNDKQAFEIKENIDGSKDLYYNGVSITKYGDPLMYPRSNPSYADIGIGMRLNDDGNIDPQSAVQMTFNGAELLGCGMDTNIYMLEPTDLVAGETYYLTITRKGVEEEINFSPLTNGSVSELQTALDLKFGNGSVTVSNSGTILANRSVLDPTFAVKNTEFAPGSEPVPGTVPPTIDFKQAKDGFPHNIIQLVLDVSNVLRQSDNGFDIRSQADKNLVARYADVIFREQTTLLKSITRVGSTEQYIEFHQDRLDSADYSLTEYGDSLEATDLASEAMYLSIYEAGYNMSLQLASKVIPQSIWNFM